MVGTSSSLDGAKKKGGGESGTLIDQSERAREKNSSI